MYKPWRSEKTLPHPHMIPRAVHTPTSAALCTVQVRWEIGVSGSLLAIVEHLKGNPGRESEVPLSGLQT